MKRDNCIHCETNLHPINKIKSKSYLKFLKSLFAPKDYIL